MKFITMIAEVVIAACAIYAIYYTVKTNNDTAREERKTAELKYRQLIVDATSTYITLSQNNSGSGAPAVDFAVDQLLDAYEAICYLKKDEILTEEFRTLYGNEMLRIIGKDRFRKKIKDDSKDFKYIKEAKNLLEDKK